MSVLRANAHRARLGAAASAATRIPTTWQRPAAMSQDEFDAINGPQAWANWRTIPRALNGHIPERPLRVLDLGCGTGSSTRVLAFYCPAGSHITGYEFAEPMLTFARRRDYRHGSGTPAQVDFICQGLTEKLPEPDASVDLVNASGVIGHHLSARDDRAVGCGTTRAENQRRCHAGCWATMPRRALSASCRGGSRIRHHLSRSASIAPAMVYRWPVSVAVAPVNAHASGAAPRR